MSTEKSTGTPARELQRQRQEREARRAGERGRAQEEGLKSVNRESGTAYGAVLMDRYAETVSIALDGLLSQFMENEAKAGPHFAYWPLLLHFSGRGPRSVGAIALTAVVDRITLRPKRRVLAQLVGRALQDEMKALRLHEAKGQTLMRMARRLVGKKAVSKRVLQQLHVPAGGWSLGDRRGVGELLLSVIVANTDLVELFGNGADQLVVPTKAVKGLIAMCPPQVTPVRDLPSLVPPEPWTGPRRGSRNLVVSRSPMDRGHLTTQTLRTTIEVVNIVEQQELVVDPWMVQTQRQAWEEGLPGLFPVMREPAEPLRPWTREPKEVVTKRVKIEETIRLAAEVAGLPLWLEHEVDFRGRLYCSSRVGGHQGPDHQKALLSFAQRERMNDEAFEQLLAGAAGHYGLTHGTWAERAQWGRAHLDQMNATALAPLDRSDLWRSAKDPWQYLQACKAISDFLADEAAPSGCPVRFDQTCSGMGIIGALTRDEGLCRLTNVIGETRLDLYSHIAAALLKELRHGLDSFDPVEMRMSEFWLKLPVGRELTKGPTMCTVYGQKNFGLVDQLIEWLQAKNPDVPTCYWEREYTRPALFMAKKLNGVIASELKSCIRLDDWLRKVAKQCGEVQERVRWNSPLGFPMALGSLEQKKQKTHTLLHGTRAWEQAGIEVIDGSISGRRTAAGITANTVHAFDAALVHAVLLRAALVQAPVLTNHDCFATIPSRAAWLHREVLLQLKQLYMPDWLAELRVEIGRSARLRLPVPPLAGTLCEGRIGENPYCFS